MGAQRPWRSRREREQFKPLGTNQGANLALALNRGVAHKCPRAPEHIARSTLAGREPTTFGLEARRLAH